MKRKLALLLAAVMIFSLAVPMNLSAAYSTARHTGLTGYTTGTLVVGSDLGLPAGARIADNFIYPAWRSTSNEGGLLGLGTDAMQNARRLANNGSGTELVFTFPEGGYIQPNQSNLSFLVTLKNAVWAFDQTISVVDADGASLGSFTTSGDWLLNNGSQFYVDHNLNNAARSLRTSSTPINGWENEDYLNSFVDYIYTTIAAGINAAKAAISNAAFASADRLDSADALGSATIANAITLSASGWRSGETISSVITQERAAIVTIANAYLADLLNEYFYENTVGSVASIAASTTLDDITAVGDFATLIPESEIRNAIVAVGARLKAPAVGNIVDDTVGLAAADVALVNAVIAYFNLPVEPINLAVHAAAGYTFMPGDTAVIASINAAINKAREYIIRGTVGNNAIGAIYGHLETGKATAIDTSGDATTISQELADDMNLFRAVFAIGTSGALAAESVPVLSTGNATENQKTLGDAILAGYNLLSAATASADPLVAHLSARPANLNGTGITAATAKTILNELLDAVISSDQALADADRVVNSDDVAADMEAQQLALISLSIEPIFVIVEEEEEVVEEELSAFATSFWEYVHVNNRNNPNNGIVPYSIDQLSNNSAVFTIAPNALGYADYDMSGGYTIYPNDVLVLPLIMMVTDGNAQVEVTVQPQSTFNSLIGYSHHVLGIGETAANAGTNATISATSVTARNRVYLNPLTITEKYANTLKGYNGTATSGKVYLTAPYGYEWVIPETNRIFISGSSTLGNTNPNFTNTGRGINLTDTAAEKLGFNVRGLGYVTGYSSSNSSFVNNIPTTSSAYRHVLEITLPTFRDDRQFTGAITINGLAIAPRTVDESLIDFSSPNLTAGINFNHYNGVGVVAAYRYMHITSSYGGAPSVSYTPTGGVSPVSSLTVGTRTDWAIDLTTAYDANPANFLRYSGLVDQSSAMITVQENALDAWTARKITDFTLVDADGNTLDGVKISRAYIATTNMRTSNNAVLYNTNSSGQLLNRDESGGRTGATPSKWSYAMFSRDGHTFELVDMYTETGKLAKATITFYLSAEPNFEGPVYVKVGGAAINEGDISNNGIVQIADFQKRIDVEATTSEVQIGNQRYSVQNIVIEELIPGALRAGVTGTGTNSHSNRLQLAIGEYGTGRLSNYMYFAPISNSDVEYDTANSLTLSSPAYNNSAYTTGGTYYGVGRVIEFTVGRASTKAGSIITISNLEVNVDRTVPYGEYDLLVGGSALVDNWQGNSVAFYYDTFDIFGVVAEGFIEVKTPASNEPLRNKVVIDVNDLTSITINGELQELEVPMLNIDGRLMVPVRYIADALGIPSESIIWDPVEFTVTIVTAERQVQFKKDSSVYTINGTPINMVYGDTAVKMYIDPATGRSYVPYRALGEAFGIPVNYNAEEGLATFN